MVGEREMDRRAFLGLGIAGVCALEPGWKLGFPASGLPLEGEGGILVVLQLSGGNDGLNTVVPFADGAYREARRRTGIQERDLHKLDEAQGLHPSLGGLKELFEAGRMAIVHGVGYPNPDRSHFKSMDIWHSADPTARDLRFGWLGRTLDLLSQEGGGPAELAINLGERPPLALNGSRYKPVSFRSPDRYGYRGSKDQRKAFETLCERSVEGGSPLLEALRRTSRDALRSSRAIRARVSGYRSPVRYPPSPVSSSLRTVAGLIAGGLPTRVYYTYQGGFDTHVNQPVRHANLLRQLDQALVAFQKDLDRMGKADRVTVMCFSEFGRRVRENQSLGTDHGTAGPAFVIGKGIRGGFLGVQPSLTDLLRGGDLRHGVDFRRLYASLIRGCLGVDPARVLGGGFESLPLFREN